MPKYLVEALVQYRVVYAIEAESADMAQDTVHMRDAPEFGQADLGEMVISTREASDEELIRVHDEVNDYLKEWTPEQKLSRVYKVA